MCGLLRCEHLLVGNEQKVQSRLMETTLFLELFMISMDLSLMVALKENHGCLKVIRIYPPGTMEVCNCEASNSEINCWTNWIYTAANVPKTSSLVKRLNVTCSLITHCSSPACNFWLLLIWFFLVSYLVVKDAVKMKLKLSAEARYRQGGVLDPRLGHLHTHMQ